MRGWLSGIESRRLGGRKDHSRQCIPHFMFFVSSVASVTESELAISIFAPTFEIIERTQSAAAFGHDLDLRDIETGSQIYNVSTGNIAITQSPIFCVTITELSNVIM